MKKLEGGRQQRGREDGAVGTGEQERDLRMWHVRQAVPAVGRQVAGEGVSGNGNHSLLKLDLHELLSGRLQGLVSTEHCQPPGWSQLPDGPVEQ